MNQLTIRGFDKDLERSIRNLAKAEGISLNQAVLRLLRRGSGLEVEGVRGQVVGDALDPFFGTWSDHEAKEFEEAVRDLEEIDPSLWS